MTTSAPASPAPAVRRRTSGGSGGGLFAGRMRFPLMAAGFGLLALLAFYFRRNLLVLAGLVLLGVFAYRRFRAASIKPSSKSSSSPDLSEKPSAGAESASDANTADGEDHAAPESTQLLQKTSPQAYPVVNDTVDEVRHEMFEHHDIKPNLTEEPGKYNRTYIDNPPAIEAGKRQDFARELAKDLTHHKDQYMQEVVVAPAAAEGGTVAESRQPGVVEVAPEEEEEDQEYGDGQDSESEDDEVSSGGKVKVQ